MYAYSSKSAISKSVAIWEYRRKVLDDLVAKWSSGDPVIWHFRQGFSKARLGRRIHSLGPRQSVLLEAGSESQRFCLGVGKIQVCL
jgi:hypothetical protein